MSQRRTDDTRQKKSVMKILRRTTTPQRISKPGTSNGSASPKRVKGNHGTWKVTSAPVTRPGSSASVLRQRPSTGLSRTSGRNSPEGKTLSELDLEGSLSVRAALRKELLDKELESCLAVRRAKALLAALQVPMAKLTGEQKELLDEREKVVKAEEARTGRYEPEAWQYMDGRLGELDQEIATVNAKIVEAEESLRLARLGAEGGSQQQDDMASPAGPGNSDLGWENALNLVRTFDPFELEAVVELYLDEIVKLRFAVEESETRESDLKQRLSDKERITAELKLASKEAERKFKKAIADAIEQSNDTKLEEREAEKENAVVRDGAVPSPTRPESKTKQAWHDDDKGEPAQPKAGIDVVAESMKPVPINLTNPPVTVHRAQVSNDMPQKAAITNIIQEAQAAPVTKSMSFMDRLALIGGGELAKRLAKNVDSKGSTRSGSPTVTSINAAASSPPVDEGNVPEEVSSRDGDSRGRDQPASPDRTLKPKASGGKSPQRSGSGSSSTSASPREILPPGVQRRAHHMRAPETISEPRERSPRWASAGDRQRVPSTSPPKRVQTPPMISPTRKTNPAPEPRRGFEANAARPPQQDELQALSPAYPTTSMNPTSSAPFQALRTAFNSAYNTTHTAPSQPPSSAPTPSTAWAFNTSVSNPNNANANLRGPTGADVFERLAHAHTLASQAKVIHRGGEAGTSTVTAPNTQTSPSNTTNQQP
ncbi:uncharacterized protein EV422DRAFT_19868 [Fimicolochytrium jonesii]|uniref:uncharacterized protein n=1 Tax=Fimicolochytrium jonesii TaxID=1396493 RepID=UPI0022FE4CA8|nr:uncharacterized protein EV422DRAFT_19868 [Fimicolochytrium jonesii]KAI8826976.1 hypothetical protein EV422DRAFT_19868 [Fimicolochytrium jonesii]